jgi:hypothetical protein
MFWAKRSQPGVRPPTARLKKSPLDLDGPAGATVSRETAQGSSIVSCPRYWRLQVL